MPATLPVPIDFQLPNESWRPVDPEVFGVRNAAFLALRQSPAGDFEPTISIGGDMRPDPATLVEIADESVELLRQEARDVELVKRREVGTPDAPGVTQLLGATIDAEGRTWDLQQVQALLAWPDVDDPTNRCVIVVTLTAAYGQAERLLPEFEEMLGSVRPHRSAAQG
jgi:hypothetical protein